MWQVNVFYGPAGEIASGKVNDATGQVTDAFTGPQVAWGMARGGNGFGGKKINEWQTWLIFCVAFLLGLVDWRRPFSLRTVDLLALLSFSPSLWFFNHGRIFAAISLVYPGFAWLIGRCLWIAHRDRGSRGSVVWPTWVLVAATLCLAGYRIDLNINHSNVIDVGLSGVIGADRIAQFQDPYGNFPVEDGRPNCGPADASGEVRDHIQTNGRCEAADPQGDTYGPVAYLAYVPGYIFLGWSGLWDSLPMAHFTTILWDLLAIIGLWFVGVRFGGPRLGAVFSFAWVAWPFTQYSSSSNTNDLIAPALLVWGFYFLTSPVKRGLFAAFSAWTKFASLVVVPLWSAYPDARAWRPRSRFVWGFLGGTALSFVILLFDPSPVHAVRVFYDHTFAYQFGRASPFSLWDWRQYHAKGLPNLRWVQRVLFGTLVAGSIALAWWPRRRSPLRMAAYTGALLIGFESVLTHWSWLYLPWFFPFVAIALLTPRLVGPVRIVAHPLAEQERIVQRTWSERQRLVVKFAAASAVFLCCWGLIGHGFYSKPRIIDVGLYQIYGSDIRDGEVPYRDFALEYPPGALPVFVAPTVSQQHYRRDFSWLMASSGVLCIAFLTLARAPRYALPVRGGLAAPARVARGHALRLLADGLRCRSARGLRAGTAPTRLGCACVCDHDQAVRGRPRSARGRLDAPTPRSRRAEARGRSRVGGRCRGRPALPGAVPGRALGKPLEAADPPPPDRDAARRVHRDVRTPDDRSVSRLAQPRRAGHGRGDLHRRAGRRAAGALGRLRPRPGRERPARPLRSRLRRCVRDPRKGALTAVHDLARSARGSRPRPARHRRDEPGRGRGRRRPVLVSHPLLRLRAPRASRLARADARPSAPGLACGSRRSGLAPATCRSRGEETSPQRRIRPGTKG